MKMLPTILLASGATAIVATTIRLPVIPPVEPTSPAKIVVSKTQDKIPQTSDPIWKVQLVVNNKNIDTVEALIGRADRQELDRHTAGNKSPLPIGTYRILRSEIYGPPFELPELGNGYWIPIVPLFSTGRSALGIHQDPSWGKTNGESGTSGCIGVRTKEDTTKIVNWIRQYDVQQIVVDS